MQVVLLAKSAQLVLKPTSDTFYLCLLDQAIDGGKVKIDLFLQRKGLNCRLLVLGRLGRASVWQLESKIHHLATKTACVTEAYFAQASKSKVDYLGEIYIDRHASHSTSLLKEQSLVLGEASYLRARPVLEISNNQVQASHSASCSRISEAELFYLMSRGLSRNEAEQILEKAFFDRILETITESVAQSMIKEYLC